MGIDASNALSTAASLGTWPKFVAARKVLISPKRYYGNELVCSDNSYWLCLVLRTLFSFYTLGELSCARPRTSDYFALYSGLQAELLPLTRQ